MRFVVYFYGGFNGAADYQQAILIASNGVSRHYVNTGSLGESFAVIYDKLNQTRTFVWMEDATHVKYRRLQSV